MPTPKWCQRCAGLIVGPVHVVELSRLTHAGPELERTITCGDCAAAVREYLRVRPEVPALEPVGSH